MIIIIPKAIERVTGGRSDFRDEKTLMCYISILFSICFIIGKKIDCLKNNNMVPYNRIHVSVCVLLLLGHKIQINKKKVCCWTNKKEKTVQARQLLQMLIIVKVTVIN